MSGEWLTPAVISRQAFIGEVALSPDGSLVAYTRRTIRRDRDQTHLWLVPLGYLAFKSGMFPKVLGIVLVVGGISYLVDTLAAFVAPEFSATPGRVSRRMVVASPSYRIAMGAAASTLSLSREVSRGG